MSAGILQRLEAAGLRPRGLRGQHFLHDPQLLQALVREAGVGRQDRVFEVGTGAGTLTRALAAAAAAVSTVDIDPRLVEFARAELAAFENIEYHCVDVLGGRRELDSGWLEELRRWRPTVWVANLPYGIATTLIVLLCETDVRWRSAHLLVQQEVAHRLAASPGEPSYGAVSALVAFWIGQRRLGRLVGRASFVPPPSVESRVIVLEDRRCLGEPEEYTAYRAWVKWLFQWRRKQLAGLLRRRLDRPSVERYLEGRDLAASVRPETLSPDDFLALARAHPIG